LQNRRKNQRNHETAIAPDLVELFADKRAEPLVEGVLKGIRHSLTL
jgi:hypothetical protein